MFSQNIKDKLPPNIQESSLSGTSYIGYFKNSQLYGIFWAGLYGGDPRGHLHGMIDEKDGKITGDNIAYIYPDMETVLLGRFEDRLMKDAQESKVLKVECNQNGMIYVNQYATPDPTASHFYYEPASNSSYGGTTSVPGTLDPYERKWLEVRKIDEDKIEEGVFAKKDAKKHIFISSYTGFTYGKSNGQHAIYTSSCINNVTKTPNERRHCKKYSLGFKARDAKIEIPPEYDQPDSFFPSMGPKVIIYYFDVIYSIYLNDYKGDSLIIENL